MSLILLNQCKKFEIKITQTMPTGVTSSWQWHQCPPACARPFIHIPHSLTRSRHSCPPLDHVGNSVLGHLSLLAKGQQGCLMSKPELCACPEIYGEKPKENSDVHCGHWVRTDKWLWVNLQQVDSSSLDITRTLRLQLSKGNRKVDV